ncbi:MAG: hypothetical protein DM484_26425 [Candidatus Methylumidiphilus alinenensis]|uniref:CdiI immunity protein domain-containing protein n=1 Tax=Candidatus Methylumidiphilus alinenensis TaxID=2202197 RepID=A0A2W4S6S3_9GAMM|nr:MAG: hypothetical protein DM484_26425 [Candidatus Methylumidiphilus alinenensis]
MQSTKYPHLQSFLSGWFHQDFDIVGNSIEAIVDEFKQVSPAADAHAVAKDIRVFISTFEGQVDNEFGRDFEIDVDPREFAPSVEAFLEQIATRLETK